MTSHLLFDRPNLDQDRQGPAMFVNGLLSNAVPSAAYEDRLTIVNAIGDCTAAQVDGDILPPGTTIGVDNGTGEVVVRWPAYGSGIINANFDEGTNGWELGYGWSIGTTSPPTPAPETGGQCGQYLRKGAAFMRRASFDPVLSPTQTITLTARINPVNKRSGSQAWAHLEWFDAARNLLRSDQGTLVEYADAWETSTVTGTAPAGAAFVKPAIQAQHAITGRNDWKTRPILVDRIAWDYPASGINVAATFALKIEVRDSVGRVAYWTGTVTCAVPSTFFDFFANGERGFWIDPSDMSTMWQDSAGTTPVTAVGQPVGRILDKSGNGNHFTQSVSGQRPTLQEAGGKRYLQFVRSSSQFLMCVNITQMQMRTDSLHMLYAAKWDTMQGYPVSRSIAAGNSPGRYYVWGGNGAGLSAAYERFDTVLLAMTSSFSDTSNPHVFSHTVNRSPGEVRTRVDGTLSGLPQAGWNDLADLTLSIRTRIGAYGNSNDTGELTGDYYNGRIYGMVVRFTTPTTVNVTQRDTMESIMATYIP